MENDEIPSEVDIIIINSIAQAGININNSDIDAVMLVGQFDPLGFEQYLGRCRKYTGYFYFLYHNYGKQISLWPGADKVEAYLTYVQGVLTNFSQDEFDSLSDINPLFVDYYTQLPDGKLVLKKCKAANLAYKKFKEANGAAMLDFIADNNPTLIVEEYMQLSGSSSQSTASQKAQYRKDNKDKLPKLIKKYASYLNSIVTLYEEGTTYDDLQEMIEDSTTDKAIAKKKNKVLYIPRTYKKGILNTLVAAKNGNVNVKHFLLAVKKYI